MIDKKKRIINFLKENKKATIERISKLIKSNQWMAFEYLAVLESEDKISRIKYKKEIYWKIKNDKK